MENLQALQAINPKNELILSNECSIKVGNKYFTEDQSIIEIGLDEVGRGVLFGRVYAGAVILPKDKNTTFDFSKIKDSKKFHSKKKIAEVAQYIKDNAIAWTVQYADEKTVDQMNILQATQECMHKCIKELIKQENLNTENLLLLVDGNYFNSFITYSKNKKIQQVEHKCIVEGDKHYASIAAASIIAKVERDNYIKELCCLYPEFIEKYSLDSNVGYGTSKHIKGIKKYGITEFHRKTFCKKILASCEDQLNHNDS